MKLEVNLKDLFNNAFKMGITQLREFDISLKTSSLKIEIPELNTYSGLEIDDLSSLAIDKNGIFIYQNTQVLLFIPNHKFNYDKVISNEQIGNKFHLTECSTLRAMKQRNKFYRYHITTNRDANFEINDGYDRSAVVELKVCRNCLEALNYKNYSLNQNSVYYNFNLNDFFELYKK